MNRRAAAPLEAFVLHHYDWSESSLILDLFTREQGRLAAVAKGAKRPNSQLRSVLLPFQRVLVSLSRPAASEGESPEVQTLRGAEWAGGAPMLPGPALFSGFYLNELLMKLLARQDPHPLLFEHYQAALAKLAAARGEDGATQAALRAFELALLRDTGVLPDLSLVTQTQQPVRPGQAYALRAEAGVVPSADEASLTAEALVQLEAALAHGSSEALQQACRAALAPLRTMLRACVHYHLGSGTLRTRQLMIELQNV